MNQNCSCFNVSINQFKDNSKSPCLCTQRTLEWLLLFHCYYQQVQGHTPSPHGIHGEHSSVCSCFNVNIIKSRDNSTLPAYMVYTENTQVSCSCFNVIIIKFRDNSKQADAACTEIGHVLSVPCPFLVLEFAPPETVPYTVPDTVQNSVTARWTDTATYMDAYTISYTVYIAQRE